MFPLCFPRADDPPPPRKPFRSRVVDASSFLSRAAAFLVFGGVSPPGVGWGARLDVGRKKNACDWYEKRLFVSFCKKKTPQKRRAKERYFTTQTSGLFNTEHQSATHHEPKNHHRAETGTDDDVPNAHHRTRRGDIGPSDDPRRRLAPFFGRGNFPISDWKSRQVEKRRLVAKGEGMAREAVTRRLVKVRFVSPFFCDSSSARIEKDDRRCRASDRRGTFLKCHAKMCSVINQSVPPNDIQKRRDGCKRLTYATRVFFGLLNLLLRAGHERSGRVRLRFFHR